MKRNIYVVPAGSTDEESVASCSLFFLWLTKQITRQYSSQEDGDRDIHLKHTNWLLP
jgi:hypothetical protein